MSETIDVKVNNLVSDSETVGITEIHDGVIGDYKTFINRKKEIKINVIDCAIYVYDIKTNKLLKTFITNQSKEFKKYIKDISTLNKEDNKDIETLLSDFPEPEITDIPSEIPQSNEAEPESEEDIKEKSESNVATAHPIAAELRGMTVPSLCSFVFIQNPKASFG